MDFRERLRGIIENLQKSLLHLAYPTKCLHCEILLPPSSLVLCPACASLLELASLDDRCPGCFNLLEDEDSLQCTHCSQYPSHYIQMAASFDYQGPASSLVKRLKYSNQPYLAKGMAALLVTQLDRLQWPLPDALVPVPISFSHWIDRGYNQSALIAEELGRLLARPVWNVLHRQSGDFSQAALNLEQRRQLGGKRFQINSRFCIENKTLLVIDDVMTSGLTLQRCGEVLQEKNPEALYALTFCRTCFD